MNAPGLSQRDPLIGTTIAGRYQVEACIGQGAMGAVYRARQAGLGRAVALKLLKRDMAWGGDTVQRFRREAQAMSALHHPNTVRVFDFGATDDGLLFLAMELLEGQPVTDQLARTGALPMREAVLYTQQVLRSIGEAHAKGIVHRDIKPDNVFVAHVDGFPDPVVKVLDFGIAKAIEGDRKIDQFETLDGTVFGTPRYMSPEQAAGKTLDPRSDLYSVGILLYEFLTGNPPFVDADAVVVMAKHIREAPLPVRRSAPQRLIPPDLEAVVTKALNKDPSQRFQNADEFDRALAHCLPEVTRFERLSQAGAHRSPVGRVLFMSPRMRALMLVGVVLLAVGGVALFASPGGSAPEATSPAVSVQVPRSEMQSASQAAGASALPPATVKPVIVTLKSEPATASVSRNGMQLGVTPLEIVVAEGTLVSVMLHKDGFADHTIELRATDRERVVELAPLPSNAARVPPTNDEPSEKAKRARPPRRGAKRKEPAPTTTPAAPSSPYEKF